MSDWRTLPADRDLDARVALLLGATWRSYRDPLGGRLRMVTFDTRPPLADGAERDCGPHTDVPCYSTRIASAWLVVESRPLGTWAWRFSQTDESDPARAWFAEVRLGYVTSYAHAYPEWAATLPLAICRTALAATEPTAPNASRQSGGKPSSNRNDERDTPKDAPLSANPSEQLGAP